MSLIPNLSAPLSPNESSRYFHQLCQGVAFIPVLVINDASMAVELAETLVQAGLPVLEVALRTPHALAVIEAMSSVEGAVVGAGTVLTAEHVRQCKVAGAEFLVSPGFTDALIEISVAESMPLLPGAATVAEVMYLAEKGFSFVKFFPAEANGGVAMLQHFFSPLPHICFCPTGGVDLNNINAYLALDNVPVVGGSWLVDQDDLQQRNWANIIKKVQRLNLTLGGGS